MWVAVDGDDLLTAHLEPAPAQARERPRATRAWRSPSRGPTIHPPGLREYLVVHGTGDDRGGRRRRSCSQELAHVYLGPDVRFPPMDDPPPGVRMRIAVERVGGVGPWTD